MLKKFALLILLVLGTFTISTNSFAGSSESAKKFVEDVTKSALSIIKSNNLSESKKQDKLESLFKKHVDTDWIGRFALGQYWKSASDVQKNRYKKYYETFLANSYVPKFKEYTDQKIKILKHSTKRNNEYLIETEIISNQDQIIKVDYKVRNSSGSYKIFDVVAEGVSLITTQRSEFGSIVSRNGLDYLIDKLEARANQT